jgi:hypothetical protein
MSVPHPKAGGIEVVVLSCLAAWKSYDAKDSTNFTTETLVILSLVSSSLVLPTGEVEVVSYGVHRYVG